MRARLNHYIVNVKLKLLKRNLEKYNALPDADKGERWFNTHLSWLFPKKGSIEQITQFWELIHKWYDTGPKKKYDLQHYIGHAYTHWIIFFKKNATLEYIDDYVLPVKGYELALGMRKKRKEEISENIGIHNHSTTLKTGRSVPPLQKVMVQHIRSYTSTFREQLQLQLPMPLLMDIQDEDGKYADMWRLGAVRAKFYEKYPQWYQSWKDWIQSHPEAYNHANIETYTTNLSHVEYETHYTEWRHLTYYKAKDKYKYYEGTEFYLDKTLGVLAFDEDLPIALHAHALFWSMRQVQHAINDKLAPDPFSGDIEACPESIKVRSNDILRYSPMARAVALHMLGPFMEEMSTLRVDPAFMWVVPPDEWTPKTTSKYIQDLMIAQQALNGARENTLEELEL